MIFCHSEFSCCLSIVNMQMKVLRDDEEKTYKKLLKIFDMV